MKGRDNLGSEKKGKEENNRLLTVYLQTTQMKGRDNLGSERKGK